METPTDYWNECISDALEDAGIEATGRQIATIAECVQISSEQYGMAFPGDMGPSADRLEIDALKRQQQAERDALVCKACYGSLVLGQRKISPHEKNTCPWCGGYVER